jgi:sarcosine oxidase subunit alpha
MLFLACPWCGPRDETEFRNGGQAHITVPADAAGLSDERWADYLYMRDNALGPAAERWYHAAGCRRWFNALRDTRTNEVISIYRPGEPVPEAQ